MYSFSWVPLTLGARKTGGGWRWDGVGGWGLGVGGWGWGLGWGLMVV